MERQFLNNNLKEAMKFLPLIALTGNPGNSVVQGKIHQIRPNIVIIMADDMGYSDIGCYGGEISTPNIDRLASQGLRFRNFYNNAKCCPSRASLLTGLYNHEAGMGGMVSNADAEIQPGPYQGFLNRKCMTIAEVLRNAGYSTYMSGKWHLGEREEHWPCNRGFDKYFGLISGASSYFELIKESRVRKMAYGSKSWTPPADGFYMTDAISDSAVAFVSSHGSQGRKDPFFLYVAYTSPHYPLHALKEDMDKYQGTYEAGWDSIRNLRYKKMTDLGIIDRHYRLSPRTPGIPPWDKVDDKELWIRRMQVYAAMIDRMDQGIGKILETLKKTGQLENTMILFLADNGGCAEEVSGRNLAVPGIPVGLRGSYDTYHEPWANVSNTPYRYYKNWLYEGGIRTPLIVYWPGVLSAQGNFTDQFGHLIDIMPTCIEVAGARYPVKFKENPLIPLRGESLLSAIKGGSVVRKNPVFWEYAGGGAMRQGNWKLVKEKGGAWELYDLNPDPTELNEVGKSYGDIMGKMIVAYDTWSKKAGVRPVKEKAGE